MRYFRLITLIIILTAASSIINSCNDSGVETATNSGSLTVQNLKPLTTSIEGYYEAFVSIETSADHGDEAYRTIGKFNVLTNGSLVDKNGNPYKPDLSRIPNINAIEDAIITIEPPGDNDTIPGESRIAGGLKTVSGSELIFNLSMNYTEVLGTRADQIASAPEANYVLAAPTTGDTNQYKRGSWFSKNINGTQAGLTLPVIPDTLGWWYQAWIIDTTSQDYYYSMGRFYNSSAGDDNSSCDTNIAPPWNLPGQDWIRLSCFGANPPITDLTTGKYKILVTLEPKFEQGSALNLPFFIKLYETNIMSQSYGNITIMPNMFQMPGGVLKLQTVSD
ncbi:MAG TPA: hypothetical protein VJ455_00675 [Ignavibacteria bacterium]|nr:hypothetical protein [Ignavibacteria bacterium]